MNCTHAAPDRAALRRLSTSAAPGADPVADARTAEALGFDFVSASDHPGSAHPELRDLDDAHLGRRGTTRITVMPGSSASRSGSRRWPPRPPSHSTGYRRPADPGPGRQHDDEFAPSASPSARPAGSSMAWPRPSRSPAACGASRRSATRAESTAPRPRSSSPSRPGRSRSGSAPLAPAPRPDRPAGRRLDPLARLSPTTSPGDAPRASCGRRRAAAATRPRSPAPTTSPSRSAHPVDADPGRLTGRPERSRNNSPPVQLGFSTFTCAGGASSAEQADLATEVIPAREHWLPTGQQLMSSGGASARQA